MFSSASRLPARAADRVAGAIARRVATELAPPAAPPEPVTPGGSYREQIDNDHLELLLGFLLGEADHCIDVGANQGRFLSAIVRGAPHGRHLAFEPIPFLAGRLRDEFPTVEVHEAALSDEAGTSEFVYVPADPGHSGLRERRYPQPWDTQRIEVRLERLDEAIPPDFAPRFIKVDVEGAELQVFRGGLETITRHRPVVVFEHGLGAADHYGTRPEDVWDVLCGDAGLRLFDMDARGPFSRDEFADVFASGSRWNFLARP